MKEVGMVEITDFPMYSITENGEVYSLYKKKFLTSNLNREGGYLRVTLYRESLKKKVLVHVLVANAFIPNPDNKPHINHINGNKLDNRVDNLEWVTHAENIQHAVRLGLKKPLRGVESPHYLG